MIKKLLGTIALVAMAGSVQATVVDFESVSGASAGSANNASVILNTGVAGLTWTQSVVDSLQLYAEPRATTKLGTGSADFMAAVGGTPTATEVAGSWIAAINNSGSNISFTSATVFDFAGLFLYGSKANEVATITGYNGATLVGTWTTGTDLLAAGTGKSYSFTTEFAGVTKIVIASTKGAMGFDNLILAAPAAAVPEASTYAMLLAGLGMIGVIARRRTQG